MPIEVKHKIHSILMGRKVRKFYTLDKWFYEEPCLREDTETIERVKILECELPLMKEKDEIFLSEQGVYATIQKVTTGTDGNMYYNISYVTEYIDELEKTKNDLQPTLTSLIQKYNKEKQIKDEREIKSKKSESEINTKVNQIKEWQQNNLDKIKGIIIQEIPRDKDGNSIINFETQEKFFNNIRLNIPKEYLVIPSMNKITYLDCEGKNLSLEIQK